MLVNLPVFWTIPLFAKPNRVVRIMQHITALGGTFSVVLWNSIHWKCVESKVIINCLVWLWKLSLCNKNVYVRMYVYFFWNSEIRGSQTLGSLQEMFLLLELNEFSERKYCKVREFVYVLIYQNLLLRKTRLSLEVMNTNSTWIWILLFYNNRDFPNWIL